MKKFIIASLAATLLATPILAAPYQSGDRHDRTEQRHDRVEQRHDHRAPNKKVDFRNWKKGDRFDQRHAHNYRVIKNPRAYRLNAAPRGHQWVRSGNDAVLVAYKGNHVANVKYGVFR